MHPTCQYPDSEALKSIISRMQHNIHAFDIDNWCCMTTLYENGQSHIPRHSGNEDSIIPDSDIYTVSISAQRILVLQNTVGPLQEQRKIELTHGSVHCMSRASQDSWEHSIPPALTPNCGPRISLTFKRLKEAPKPKIPPIAPPTASYSNQSEPTPTIETSSTRPKRLLMLSDSLHIAFPAHLFDKAQLCASRSDYQTFASATFTCSKASSSILTLCLYHVV